jgi:membrane-associated progesterone receptor component
MTTVFTIDELAKFNGTDSKLPIYLGVKGIVYDVSTKAEFYGVGGGYSLFSGREASRGLAKSSTKP